MKHLRKRNKLMALLGAAICSITAVVPTGLGTTVSAINATPQGTVEIPKLGIVRTIYVGDTIGIIDQCLGAANLRAIPGNIHLAAHRKDCGSKGFGGVENLRNGDKVIVTLNGKRTEYTMFAEAVSYYGARTGAPPVGGQLTLQTSYSQYKKDTRVYLKYFQPTGIPNPQGNSRRKVSQGSPVCVTIPGARKNDWVFVNVTPVDGGGGFTTLYPAGNKKIVPDPRREPSTSSANWTSGAPSPNTTLVQAGDGSKVCAATYGSPVHIIFDALAIGSADKFTAAQQRILDTRITRQTVNNGAVCFSVPNGANRWAVLNLTAIGHSAGWGRLERASNRNTYSNVNFNNGDVDANMVTIKIPSDGRLCYRGDGTSDAVIDLIAFANSGTFIDTPAVPNRIMDVRSTTSWVRVLAANASNGGGVNNGWAFVNATPLPTGGGLSRLYDCQVYPASGSDVNYGNRIDPNVAVLKTGAASQMCIATTASQAGWVLDMLAAAHPNTFREPGHRRILDTRL